MFDRVAKDFKKVYAEVAHFPNLIIDIRQNGGGNSMNGEQIATYLLSKKQKACVSPFKIRPKSNSFKGNLFLLIGTSTSSAAESFALDLRESETVVLVGTATGGDTGNRPKGFRTDYGFNFGIPVRKVAQISPKGFPMEGVGIPPHYNVEQSIEDYFNQRDTVLEYVVDHLIGADETF